MEDSTTRQRIFSLAQSSEGVQNGTKPPVHSRDTEKKWSSFVVYKQQETPYAKLLASPFGTGVVNFFLSLSLCLCLFNFAFNYAEGRRITHTIEVFISLVGYPRQWIIPVITWFCMFLGYILIYFCFLVWAQLHCFSPKFIGPVFVLMYVLYQLTAVVIVTRIAFGYNTSFHLGGVLGCEWVRMFMKSYGFISVNARKVLYPWKTTDEEHKLYHNQLSPELPDLRRFLYFFFAPVFIYRDEYPRLKKTNYKRMVWHIGEFFGSQIIALMIGATFIVPYFRLVPTDPVRYLVLSFAMCALMGPFFTLCVHIAVIHAPYNVWAEIMRFADRGFYEDWWTSTDYRTKYRKWHIVIHDWLRYCVQEDLKKVTNDKALRKALPVVIIAISSAGHDYAYCMCTRFYMPSLSLFFLIAGSLVYFLTRGQSSSQWNNWFVVSSFSVGLGMCGWPYFLEAYARDLCPVEPTIGNAFRYQLYHCVLSNITS
jgi:sterol O-acyltransferase